MRPSSARIFLWVGLGLWGVVTLAAVVIVLGAPADHVELAIGIVLIWVVLIVFAAASRLTESLGRTRRR